MTTITRSPDRFGGWVCEVAGCTPATAAEFEAALDGLLADAATAGVRGLWVRVPLAAAAAVPPLAARGFELHHAQPGPRGGPPGASPEPAPPADRGYIMLCRWLPGASEPNTLPAYAHHFVGVGGLVVAPTGEMLVVAERWALPGAPGEPPLVRWKLPGGLVDRGERLEDAVAREVREETGVRARPRWLVAARHTTTYAFSCSDVYAVFLCGVEPGGPVGPDGLPPVTADPSEIAAARWMHPCEFLALPGVYPLNKALVAQALLAGARRAPRMRVDPQAAAFGGRTFKFDVLRLALEEARGGGEGGGGGGAGATADAPPAPSPPLALLEEPEIAGLLGAFAAGGDAAAGAALRQCREWLLQGE